MMQESFSSASPVKIDAAVNIFAKPFQTALAVLSLLKYSGSRLNKLWLQFEPAGSQFDEISAYYIAGYLQQTTDIPVDIHQPEKWLARECADKGKLGDKEYRQAIRYQKAFEESEANRLFVMHNDVVILKDIIGAMNSRLGEYFAIGQLGQCWNCPASRIELTQSVMRRSACSPDHYDEFLTDLAQTRALYEKAEEKSIFVRPYHKDEEGNLLRRPWPLPECRINEWACLINLDLTRFLTSPYGNAFPFGAFKKCGEFALDIGVEWFRDMHAHGLKAKNFNLKGYIKHWVGTGNKSARNYAINENNALLILKRNYKDYLKWLEGKSGKSFL